MTPTILVVEDEDSVRRLMVQSLSLLGYSVIEASSQAQAEAPSLQSAFVGEGPMLFIKQFMVFLMAGAALWLAADFDSEALFWAVKLLIMLVLPASIIRLALDKELGAALSPELVGQVIKAMGWRYLILWVFLFILWQSPDYVTYMLAHGLPRVVLLPIAVVLFSYFAVVMCAMMGYAVFQYQGALGYVVADERRQNHFPVIVVFNARRHRCYAMLRQKLRHDRRHMLAQRRDIALAG